jgi:hypothetical protein
VVTVGTPGPGIDLEDMYMTTTIGGDKTLPALFPSGTTLLVVAVKFSSDPPDETILEVEVVGNSGPIEVEPGFLFTPASGTGLPFYLSFELADGFADGPYQTIVTIDDTPVALLNWAIGTASP